MDGSMPMPRSGGPDNSMPMDGSMFEGNIEVTFQPGIILHATLMSFAVFILMPLAISLKFRAGYMHRHGLVQLATVVTLTLGALWMGMQTHLPMREPTDVEASWAMQHASRGWVLVALVWLQALMGYGKVWTRVPCCAAITRWRLHARLGYPIAFCLFIQALFGIPENVKATLCPRYACFEGFPISGHLLVSLPTMAAALNILVVNWEGEVDPALTFRFLNRGLVVFMSMYLFVDGLMYGFPNLGEHSMFIWNGLACYVLALVLKTKSVSYPVSRIPYTFMFLILGGSFLTDPHMLHDPISSLIHKVVGAFFAVGGLFLLSPSLLPGMMFIYMGGWSFMCAMPQMCKFAYFSHVMPYSYVSCVTSLGILMLGFQLMIWVVPSNTERVPLWKNVACPCTKKHDYLPTPQDDSPEDSALEMQVI